MRERTVGLSGLSVGAIGVGTLTWGRDTDQREARRQVELLLDHGGNLIDTSPAFGTTASEACVGEVIESLGCRDRIVLCTRAAVTRGRSGLRFSSGRGPIFDSVHDSLERLRTDYLDVLLVGAPDVLTPDDETASALGALVRRGVVRYIGVQDYDPWRAVLLNERLRAQGLPLLTVMEREYSLVERSVEETAVPMATHCGLGIFASSPLGRGVLTGKYRHSIPATSRAASEHLAGFVEPYLDDRARRITEAVAQAADGLGRTPADIALAWVLQRRGVSAALVGARTAVQLQQALELEDDLPQLVSDVLDEVSASSI